MRRNHGNRKTALRLPVYIVVDPLRSNSMKSRNPHSGFHAEEVAQCLDTSTQNPIRNGGGGVVVFMDRMGIGKERYVKFV